MIDLKAALLKLFASAIHYNIQSW